MSKAIIPAGTEKVVEAFHFVPGRIAGNLLFISGQLGVNNRVLADDVGKATVDGSLGDKIGHGSFQSAGSQKTKKRAQRPACQVRWGRVWTPTPLLTAT